MIYNRASTAPSTSIHCVRLYPKETASKWRILETYRDMETNGIFRGFCINRFGIGSLHYITGRSDFGFEFSEIFVFEKRLPDSTIRGVGDSPYQLHAESATLRQPGVDDSPHHWYAESTTPRMSRLLNPSGDPLPELAAMKKLERNSANVMNECVQTNLYECTVNNEENQ